MLISFLTVFPNRETIITTVFIVIFRLTLEYLNQKKILISRCTQGNSIKFCWQCKPGTMHKKNLGCITTLKNYFVENGGKGTLNPLKF